MSDYYDIVKKVLGLSQTYYMSGVTNTEFKFDNLFKWECKGERLYLIFAPPIQIIDFTFEYNFWGASQLIQAGEIIESCSFNTLLLGSLPRFKAPCGGLVVNNIPEDRFVGLQVMRAEIISGDKPIYIDYSQDAINAFILSREERVKQSIQDHLAKEKKEIADKIKEKYRRQQLEKLVRQELIDSGELFEDQPKRPSIPREIVDAIYVRDGGRCVYCGAINSLQLDHIIPFSKGGATSLENLQLLCQKCNINKSNKIG